MNTDLFECFNNFSKSSCDINYFRPLIGRIYQIVSVFLKYKYRFENFTNKQIEEETIEWTTKLLMKNGMGIPLIIENMINDATKIENSIDLEYWLFRYIQNYICMPKET